MSIGRRVRQWQLSYIDNDQRQERHQRDASLSVRRPAAIGQRRSLRSTHETVPVGKKKIHIFTCFAANGEDESVLIAARL